MFVESLKNAVQGITSIKPPFFLIGPRGVVHRSGQHRSKSTGILEDCGVDEGMNRASVLNPHAQHFEGLIVKHSIMRIEAKLVRMPAHHAASR